MIMPGDRHYWLQQGLILGRFKNVCPLENRAKRTIRSVRAKGLGHGKVKCKVVVYLGKTPFEKFLQMLREGKITVGEVAQIRYREKPVGYQDIMVYALAMECRGTLWAKVSFLEEVCGTDKAPHTVKQL